MAGRTGKPVSVTTMNATVIRSIAVPGTALKSNESARLEEPERSTNGAEGDAMRGFSAAECEDFRVPAEPRRRR
jgi:hypothetical protein